MANPDIGHGQARQQEAAAGSAPHPEASVVRTLDHVYYWVMDMDRAAAFYADVLGLHQVRRDGASWAVFEVGGRTLALHGAVEGRPGPGPGAGGAAAVFAVDDLDQARAVLADRGVIFDHVGAVEGYARFAAFRDPDGNTLQLIEYEDARDPGRRTPAGRDGD